MSNTQPTPVKHPDRRGKGHDESTDTRDTQSRERDRDPARIELTDGSEIDAQHYFVSKDGLVAVYTGPRSAGIDYRVPLASIRLIDTTPETVSEVTRNE